MNKPLLLIAACLFASYVILPAQPVTMDRLIGINTRASDPAYLTRPFENVREYHAWADDVGDSPLGTATCPEDFDATVEWPFPRYRFNPSFSNAALVAYDDYLQALYQRAVPVLHGLAPLMRGYHHYPAQAPQLLDQKPFCLTGYYQWPGTGSPPPSDLMPVDHANPQLYRSQSLWHTLVAARYGGRGFGPSSKYYTQFLHPHYVTQPYHSVWDDIVERQPQRHGLGAVGYIECNNEPEKSWYDPPTAIAQGQGNTYWQATAPQYAAQLSAAYDGHGRSAFFRIPTLTDSSAWLGIKNVDPDLKVVFAGLADFRGKYLEDAISWFRNNRQPGNQGFQNGPALPFDVVNFHHYGTTFSADDHGGPHPLATRYADIAEAPLEGEAISPEADNLRQEIVYTAERLEQFEPAIADKEFWLSEFGYDSDGDYSHARVPEIAGQDRQKTQAQWLVRALLEIAAARRVSKAMLYELRDEPALTYSNFGFCGLTTYDYRPKRAWFYVLTLKNVLTGYAFAPENLPASFVSTDVAAILSAYTAALSTRVYKFTRGDDQDIYVVWSPTASGETYTAGLRFAPGVQFNQASLVTIGDQDENGRWTDWSDSLSVENSGQRLVRGLPVGETPVFLVLNSARQDTMVPPAIYLDAVAISCDAVKLTWQSDPRHERYRIYYTQKKNAGPPLPVDFTAPNFQMVPGTFGGAANALIIPGLETKKTYRFYIVPVSADGELPMNWSQYPVYAEALVANCSPGAADCLIDLQPYQVSYNGQPAPPGILELLSADYEPPIKCYEALTIAGVTTSWDDWDWGNPNALQPTIVIDLLQPYLLDVVYILDSYGKGRLRIEYRDCNCTEWQPLTTLELNSDFNRWMHLANLRPVPIRYLRITKLDPDARIRRVFLSGRAVACPPPVNTNLPPAAVTALAAAPVWPRRATLRWQTVPFDPASPALGKVSTYQVRYSHNWAPNGTLINPIERSVAGSPWEKTAYLELTGLTPGTAYRAEVMPVFGVAGCPAPPVQATTVEFITPALPGALRAAPRLQPDETDVAEEQARARLVLRPNPTDRWVNVDLPANNYERLRVTALGSGLRILEQRLAPGATTIALDLEGLPAGVYIVRAEGGRAPAAWEKLVVFGF